MAIFTSNEIEKCSAELKRLLAARVRLDEEESRDAARLTELRARQPQIDLDAFIDGAPEVPKGEWPETVKMRHEIDGLAAMLLQHQNVRPKLMARIRDAVTAVARARAAVIRKEAAKLEAKLATHRAKVAEHLASLKSLDGCEYGIKPQLGTSFSPGYLEAAVLMANRGIGPASAKLLAEIDALLRQADNIERQAADACRGGRAVAGSLAALVTAVEGNVLAPSRAALEAFYAAAAAESALGWERQHRSRPLGDPLPPYVTDFTVEWDGDGNILRTSGWVNREVISTANMDAAMREQAAAVHAHNARAFANANS